jgi:hypothetical protein
MSDTPITRVTSLIQLAGSDNENEARSAAYEACRLIRVHHLIVVRTIETGGHLRPFAQDPAPRAYVPPQGIPIKDLKVSEGARKPAPRARVRVRPVVMASPVTTPIQMKSKFSGTCEDCHRPYAQGSNIWYRRGVGAVHATCEPEALV